MALQRESLKALNAFLPSDQFVLRDERVDDFGVDVSLEVLLDEQATNFRSQVQLKGRTGLVPNVDGSFSVSGVPSANLNYLLNGTCPVYILYRPETRQLHYAFARDERERLSREVESWASQETVTVRFREVLDPGALARIRERIVRESMLHRRLFECVVPAAAQDATRVQIDGATLQATSGDDAARVLVEHGIPLVSRGRSRQVLNLASLLSATHFRDAPKLLLVRGFAEFANQNYFRADPSLREALARRTELDAEDRCLLSFLAAAVDVGLGHLSIPAFLEKSSEWTAGAHPSVALQYELMNAWLRWSTTSESSAKADAERALRAAIDGALRSPALSATVRHHAEFLSLFLEVGDILDALGQAMVLQDSEDIWRHAYDLPPAAVVAAETTKLIEWRTHLARLAKEVASSGHVPLYWEIRFGLEICETAIISRLDLISSFAQTQPPGIPDELFDRVRETRRLALEQDQIETGLRGLLLESSLEDIRGNLAASTALAQEALSKAEALRFHDVARVARKALSGVDRVSVRREEIKAFHADGGFERHFAEESDAFIEQRALETCTLLRIPADRAAVLVDAAHCEREVSRHRLSWCRHLTTLEDATHAAHRDLLYARRPDRVCRCERHGSRSLVPSANWAALIEAFKKNVCAACSDRKPFQADSRSRD